MIYVIIAIVGIVIFIVSVVLVKKKSMEEKSYYEAAQQMVKEEYLTDSLKNVSGSEYHPTVIPMLYLKLCSAKPKQGYVFNPENEITIGRDKNSNSIWIPFPMVSMKHCSIVCDSGRIYLKDSGSANGTIVQKGLKKYLISNYEFIELESKDKIIISDAVFKVAIFYFNTMKK